MCVLSFWFHYWLTLFCPPLSIHLGPPNPQLVPTPLQTALRWAVQCLQLFAVKRSEELSLPFVLALHDARQFSLRCRYRYASEVSPPSLRRLCVSLAQPPTLMHQPLCAVRCLWRALVSRDQTELRPSCVRFSCCSPNASASGAVPRLCPLELLLPDCVLCSSSASSRPLVITNTQYK